MADLINGSDWREEDAVWERLQQDVLAALALNDHSRARRRIGDALTLAKEHFQTGDPRLAATLACQARLLQKKSPSLASRLFQEARAEWGQAAAWLARQPPPDRKALPGRPSRPGRLARSSSFHLRLESKHPGAYQERLREELKSLLTLGQTLTGEMREARSASETVERGQIRSGTDLAFDTHRKVMTAVDLLRDCLG